MTASALHVVALSGGKDSTAMALRLAEVEPRDYTYVITPTGNEFPEMVAHWRHLSEMLGKPLTVVTTGKSLHGMIREQKMLPNHAARWCTRKLKLEPYYAWLKQHTPCTSYVGLRADEESRAGMIFPEAAQVTMDFPMQRWGWKLDDVLSYLRSKSVSVPERTDCMDCFWQKLGEWYRYWLNDRENFDKAAALEEWVSAERGGTYTFRSPQRDKWPASLRELGARFAAGEIPTLSLKMMDKRREIGACRVCTL
jgi:3'-phosphoadenosine 5'-phosphosulfate sulfotransferase (PAPS reductase)/FAD synthetase